MIQADALGLYIHIPFCERKCPYCDFNTYAGLQSLFQNTVEALCGEMQRWRERLAERTISSIFLGGGTPTVLEDAQLAQLFATIHACFRVVEGAEITSEANPGTVDRARFTTLRSLGVNRLSMGVQSLQPTELQFLGRIHGVDDVYRAVEAARSAGFDNLNLDFMFGLPDQRVKQWDDTLSKALGLEAEHLSLYSLIVEPNTPMARWVTEGTIAAPDEDLAADHYELAMQRLADAGYHHYEVSNWAKKRPTDSDTMPSLASQHNLLYWRNQEYLGIGPGAHSHLRLQDQASQPVGRRWGNRKPVPSYVKRIAQGDSVEEFHEQIDTRTAMGETMMLGLRLVDEGVGLERFAALHNLALTSAFKSEVNRLHAQGMLSIDSERVHLSKRGLMVGNQIFMQFLN